MAACWKCGAEVDGAFCSKCGAQQNAWPPVPVQSPIKPPKPPNMKVRGLLGALAAVVLGGTCVYVLSQPPDHSSDTAGAIKYACQDFRSAMAQTDTLTVDELRAKMKKVDDLAASATPGIRLASHQFLVDLTQGNSDAYVNDATRFSDACRANGH